MDERWIVIPRWHGPDGFQHYKDRNPTWIKNYVELLSSDDYLRLSFRRRGILHGLWLLYAASDGRVLGSSMARLGRMLGEETVRARDLEALNDAGFIQFSASKPLALRYQRASAEKKREGSKEPSLSKSALAGPLFVESEPASAPNKNSVCPECGVGGGQHIWDCPTVYTPE